LAVIQLECRFCFNLLKVEFWTSVFDIVYQSHSSVVHIRRRRGGVCDRDCLAAAAAFDRFPAGHGVHRL